MRLRARWIALMVGVVLAAFGVVLAVQHRDEPSVPRLVQQHAPAPQFELTTLDGTKIDNASLAGKTYVVNFFNSWCIPCHQEEPALQAFYEEHQDESDFEFIGIVRDDEEAAIRAYVKNVNITRPVAIEGAAQAALDFGATGQPETYVVGSDGTVMCGTIGPSTHAVLNFWLDAARNGRPCA